MIDISARCPRLVTKRLVLRELELGDARAIAQRAGDRRVAKYLIAVPSPYPVTLATRWLAARIDWWSQGRGVTLAIAHRAAPTHMIGTVSLRRFARDRRAELGYWLGAEDWGRGYATEAAGALVDFGFAELGLARIYAQVIAGNEASCHVLEKLGMEHEGLRRRHIKKGKRLRDVEMYGLLREEWATCRE